MITANVIGVEQKMDFSSQVIKNYVLLEIGGKKIHAEVPDISELSELIAAGMGEEMVAPGMTEVTSETAEEFLGALNPENPLSANIATAQAAIEAVTGKGPAPDPSTLLQQPVTADDDVFDWRTVSDEALPAKYKLAMTAMEVPSPLPALRIGELAQTIENEFSEEDWREVYEVMGVTSPQEEFLDTLQHAPAQEAAPMQVPVQAPQPVPAAPPQPPVGQVQWTGGSIVQQSTPARKVQADENGYPIVSNSDVDPGEVVGGGDALDEDGIGQA